VKLELSNYISVYFYSLITIALPFPVKLASLKSVSNILMFVEIVFMKWPEIGLLTSNPENVDLLLVNPLIDNVEHVDAVINIADEPTPILFSMN
jgi:hypothetical protein